MALKKRRDFFTGRVVIEHTGVFLLLIASCSFLCAQPSERDLIDSLNELSWKLKNSEPEEAYNYARKAEVLSIKLKYQEGLGDSYSRQGTILFKQGNLEKAVRVFEKSLQIRERLFDRTGIASCLDNLSQAHRDLGNLDKALILGIKSLDLRLENKDSSEVASSLITLGNIFEKKEDYSEAKEYQLKALEVSRKTRSIDQQAKALNNIGLIHYKLLEPDSALKYFTKSQVIEKSINNLNGMAESYNNIALVFWYKGELQKAISYFDSSLVLHRQLEAQDAIAAVLSNRGEVFLEKGEDKRAEGDFNEGIVLAKYTGEVAIYGQLLYNQYRLYYSRRDYKNALTAYNKFHSVDSLLRNELIDKNFKDINIKYETEKKERENTELRARNAEQQIDINRKKQIMWTLGLTLVIAALAGTFLLYRQRQKTLIARKDQEIKQRQIDELLQKQELASINAMMEGQEQERQRIAQDLHDRIGSQLAAVKLNMEALEDKVDKGQSQNKDQFHKTYGMLDHLVDEVRKISHNMVSGVLMKFGLEVALNDLAASISNSGKIKVDVHAHGLEKRIQGKVEITVYRIIQELLANVLKHASASHITVSLTRQDGNLNVMVEDDGRGFDPAQVKKGMGLYNVQQRAETLSGTVNIDAKPGRGTTVIVDIPIT